MSVAVRLTFFSESDLERLVGRVWQCLEQNKAESPSSFTIGEATPFVAEFAFDSLAVAALIKRNLADRSCGVPANSCRVMAKQSNMIKAAALGCRSKAVVFGGSRQRP